MWVLCLSYPQHLLTSQGSSPTTALPSQMTTCRHREKEPYLNRLLYGREACTHVVYACGTDIINEIMQTYLAFVE